MTGHEPPPPPPATPPEQPTRNPPVDQPPPPPPRSTEDPVQSLRVRRPLVLFFFDKTRIRTAVSSILLKERPARRAAAPLAPAGPSPLPRRPCQLNTHSRLSPCMTTTGFRRMRRPPTTRHAPDRAVSSAKASCSRRVFGSPKRRFSSSRIRRRRRADRTGARRGTDGAPGAPNELPLQATRLRADLSSGNRPSSRSAHQARSRAVLERARNRVRLAGLSGGRNEAQTDFERLGRNAYRTSRGAGPALKPEIGPPKRRSPSVRSACARRAERTPPSKRKPNTHQRFRRSIDIEQRAPDAHRRGWRGVRNGLEPNGAWRSRVG